MRLVYRTAIATLVQFILMSVFALANGVNSIASTCRAEKGDCVSNLIVSLIFFMITCGWFAAIWILGSIAQEQRSKRFAQLLILMEVGVGMIALFNARHHTDKLSLVTSVTDVVLAAWVIVLAFRLSRAGDGRIVRRRRRPVKSD